MTDAQTTKARPGQAHLKGPAGELMRIPSVELGGVHVSVMRTCVMPASPSGLQVLPPAVGVLPIVSTGQFPKAAEVLGTDADLMTVLPAGDAFWLNIASGNSRFGDRYGLIVGANGVNTITGRPFTPTIERGAFYAVPGQQYVDGANNGLGSVGQFVAQPLGLGDGLGEQLYDNTEFGGLDFAVFRKSPAIFQEFAAHHDTPGSYGGYGEVLRGGAPSRLSFGGSQSIGMGASMHQRTVRGDVDGFDPDGPRHQGRLHLLDPDLFAELTGQCVKFKPVSAHELVDAGDVLCRG